MIQWREGDLFESGLPALAHGVNCQGLMGAGIARQFADRYPLMRDIYHGTCLGHGLRLGGVLPYQEPLDDSAPWIFNLATQWLPGADARPWAISTAVGQMILLCQELDISKVGMPLIGCGIGGLNEAWLDVILKPFGSAPVDLVVYRFTPQPAGGRLP